MYFLQFNALDSDFLKYQYSFFFSFNSILNKIRFLTIFWKWLIKIAPMDVHPMIVPNDEWAIDKKLAAKPSHGADSEVYLELILAVSY